MNLNCVRKPEQSRLIMKCRQRGLSDYQWCSREAMYYGILDDLLCGELFSPIIDYFRRQLVKRKYVAKDKVLIQALKERSRQTSIVQILLAILHRR